MLLQALGDVSNVKAQLFELELYKGGMSAQTHERRKGMLTRRLEDRMTAVNVIFKCRPRGWWRLVKP